MPQDERNPPGGCRRKSREKGCATEGRADISHMLADRMEDLCWELFPNGRVEGNWFHAEGWRGDPMKAVHVNLEAGKRHVMERRWVSSEPDEVQ